MANKNDAAIGIPRLPCVLLLTLLLTGCPKEVSVPTSGDSAPVVAISATLGGGQDGYIEIPTFQFAGPNATPVVSNATAGRGITILGSAKNGGGVQSFTIVITSQSRVVQKLDPIQKITKVATKTAAGLVPDTIPIVVADDNSVLIAKTDDLAIVQVLATNFNGDTTTGTIAFYPVDASIGHNLQITDFVLAKQTGTSLFSGTFPIAFPGSSVRANGHIWGLINSIRDTMHMLPPGGDCTVPDPSVLPFLGEGLLSDSSLFLLIVNTFPGSGAKIWDADIKTLYGASQVSMPVAIAACEKTIDPNSPNPLESKFSLPIRVVYKFN